MQPEELDQLCAADSEERRRTAEAVRAERRRAELSGEDRCPDPDTALDALRISEAIERQARKGAGR